MEVLKAAAAGDVEKLREVIKDASQDRLNFEEGDTFPLLTVALAGKKDCVEVLLEAKADVNYEMEGRSTLDRLAYPWNQERSDICKLLVEKKARICERTYHRLLDQGQVYAVARAVECGVKVDAVDCGVTRLMKACKENNLELVKVLVEHKASLDAIGESWKTPLLYAASERYEELCYYLIEQKADVTQATDRRENMLHFAASMSGKMCKMMLDMGVEMQGNKYREWPLVMAVNNAKYDCVAVLLEAKADVNQESSYGPIVSSMAKSIERLPLMKLLIEHKATIDEWTLFWLAEAGEQEIVKNEIETKNLSVSQVLDTRTMLHYAAEGKSFGMAKWLVEAKCPVDTQDRYKQTPLLAASLRGCAEIIKLLVDNNANINHTTEKSNGTCLHHAASFGNADLVEFLIDKKAELEAKLERTEQTPLHLAIKNNHLAAATVLINKGASLTAKDYPRGELPMTYALQSETPQPFVKLLLDHHAELPSINESCARGDMELVKTLLSLKAPVEPTGDSDSSPLIAASMLGKGDIVKLLLELKANVNTARGWNKVSPLWQACSHGRPECVQILIEAKADVNATDNRGDSCLHKAVEAGKEEKNLKCARLLLENNAATYSYSSSGHSALYIALERNYNDHFKQLLEFKASIWNTAGIRDDSPLKKATLMKNTEVMQLLIERKAHIQDAIPYVRTVEVAQTLLDAKVDVDTRDNEGVSLLMHAAYEGKEDIVKFLLNHNAALEPYRGENSKIVKVGETAVEIARGQKHEAIVNIICDHFDIQEKRAVNTNQFLIKESDLEIDESLGKGGQGLVFAAFWKSQPVACKRLATVDKKTRDGLIQEASLILSLNHPGIVRVHGIITGERTSVVMERCTSSLNQEIYSSKPFPWSRRIRVSLQIADAMSGLHTLQPPLFHRDLKSYNVLIRHDGSCCLCDFGLAKLNEYRPDAREDYLVGTRGWIAPEFEKGLPYTAASDVYSYGITMFEILTRKSPLKAVENGRPVIPPEALATAPPEYVALMKECWDENPTSRPSFRQIVRRLRAIKVSEEKSVTKSQSQSDEPVPITIQIQAAAAATAAVTAAAAAAPEVPVPTCPISMSTTSTLTSPSSTTEAEPITISNVPISVSVVPTSSPGTAISVSAIPPKSEVDVPDAVPYTLSGIPFSMAAPPGGTTTSPSSTEAEPITISNVPISMSVVSTSSPETAISVSAIPPKSEVDVPDAVPYTISGIPFSMAAPPGGTTTTKVPAPLIRIVPSHPVIEPVAAPGRDEVVIPDLPITISGVPISITPLPVTGPGGAVEEKKEEAVVPEYPITISGVPISAISSTASQTEEKTSIKRLTLRQDTTITPDPSATLASILRSINHPGTDPTKLYVESVDGSRVYDIQASVSSLNLPDGAVCVVKVKQDH